MEEAYKVQSSELLDSIYQGAGMGRELLGKLIKSCEDVGFNKAMADQFAEYQSVIEAVEAFAKESGDSLDPLKKNTKSAASGALKLNMMIDKTPSHLAEMIIQGSTMGIIELKRKLRESPAAAEEVKALAQRLAETERNNINSMLEYV